MSTADARELHFEVTRSDLEHHRSGRLDGLLLVSATQAGSRRYGPSPSDFPAVTFVPIDALLDPRKGLRLQAMRGHGKRKVSVVPSEGGAFELRIPRPGARRNRPAIAPLRWMEEFAGVAHLVPGSWR